MELSFSSKDLRNTCNSKRKLKNLYPHHYREIQTILADLDSVVCIDDLQGIYSFTVSIPEIGIVGSNVIIWAEAIPELEIDTSEAIRLERVFRLKLKRIELDGGDKDECI
ncbi:MAG: hypothetical protein JXR16_11735 [Bermanella sp.]